MLSPVSMDSSTDDSPSTTVASVAIFSPGRMSMMSPGTRSDDLTTDSTLSLTTVAWSGAISRSFLRESLVLYFERASRYFPMLTRAMIIPAESKLSECSAMASPVHTRYVPWSPMRTDAVHPRDTSESMVGLFENSAGMPFLKKRRPAYRMGASRTIWRMHCDRALIPGSSPNICPMATMLRGIANTIARIRSLF